MTRVTRGSMTIPSGIGALTRLKSLLFQGFGSGFGGTVPDSIGNLTALTYVSLTLSVSSTGREAIVVCGCPV